MKILQALIVFSAASAYPLAAHAQNCIPQVVSGSVLTEQGSTSVPGPSFNYTVPAAQDTLLVVHLDQGYGGTLPTASISVEIVSWCE